MTEIIFHLIGDYLTQSDWMSRNKSQRWWPALVHAAIYTIPFALFYRKESANLIILWSHFLIDRYALARYVVFAKNFMCPPAEWPIWDDCHVTGYPSSRPIWLSFWLLIIADNTLHLICNHLALRFL